MVGEEQIPNLDWGYSGDGTISEFSFTTLPKREGVLRLTIRTKEGRELDFIITHNATVGLQKACEQARQKLGF